MIDRARIACLFATSGHSGVDRIVQRLLPAIAARGHAVTLFRLRHHGPAVEPAPGLEVVELDAAHVATAGRELARRLRTLRPDVLLADKDRVNRLARRALDRAGVDARLVMRNGTTVSVDLARRKPLDRWLQHRSMRRTYDRADAVLMPSRGAADDFARVTGLARERIRVVPSPVVDDTLFQRAEEPVEHPWLAGKDRPVILGVGELGARKDFATLLRAFARLRAERPARLIILGRGKRREALLAEAEALGVAADVDLPGFDPNPYRYMARADAFALASRWEGLGLVLVEALALGTPAAATDCPSGPREVLDDGRLGPLVPVGDDAALAAALHQLLAHPPLPGTLQAAARPYTVEASVTAYLEAMGVAP